MEKDKRKVVGVRLEAPVYNAISSLADHSGVSMSRLFGLSVERLLADVKRTGKVPLPEVPAGLLGEATTGKGGQE